MSTTTDVTGHPFRHPAFFYQELDELARFAVAFLREGLAAGEPALVAAPQPQVDLIRDGLGAAAGQVRFLDMVTAGRNPGRIIPSVLRAFLSEHHPAAVRIIGEPIWPGRSEAEYAAAVQHEALINLAFEGRPATILCPYDARRLEPAALADALRTHPEVWQDGSRVPSPGWGDPWELVDELNQPLPEPAELGDALVLDSRTLHQVREFVTAAAVRAGLSAQRTDDLCVAAAEVATNTVIHSGRPGIVCVWQDATALVCEVSDSGHITDPLVGRIPPGPEAFHGRGLLRVQLLCDLVQLHSSEHGTTVRMHMQLR